MKRRWGEFARSSSLLSGAATLGAAAIVSKLLGTLQKIPLQNIGGDEVFGIYNAVYPLYILVLYLATAGFPVAVSTFVAERIAKGEHDEADRILRLAMGLMAGLGLIAFVFLFFGADQIARWADNAHIGLAIRSVSFAFLFVPVMAALRGYYQGQQYMLPTGVSQVGEQMVRVMTMVILLIWFTQHGYSEDWIAAGATFGSVTGAIAGLAIMVYFHWRNRVHDKQARDERRKKRDTESNAMLLKRLVLFALPVCLGAIAVPVLNIVDTFTVPRLLKQMGMSETAAMGQFGIYSRGLPLVQLVSMLFSSIAVALVPAFSEAKALGQRSILQARAERVLRFTWLIGLAASVGLALTALPVNVMLYTDRAGTSTMALLAFTAVGSVINVVTASMLQGLGQVNRPAFHLLLAAAIKCVLNAIWVPLWGIRGAAAAAVVAFMVAAVLNVIALAKAVSIHIRWKDYIVRPVVPLGAMSLYLLLVAHGLEALLTDSFGTLNRAVYTALGLVSVAGGGLIYMLTILRFGGITREEMHMFSRLARKNHDRK
jgi:O-antigen/teichoic acid export membrane protein